MAQRYKQADIKNFSQQSVFFDANVLIYIFWPQGESHWQVKRYSSIFKELLKNKIPLLTNIAVISEVINRILRIEYTNYKASYNSPIEFKDYRNSTDGLDAQENIYTIITHTIMPCFSLIDDSFLLSDFTSLLTVDSLDFTDKIIAATCKLKKCILLTNDSDFKDSDIAILSEHRVFHSS